MAYREPDFASCHDADLDDIAVHLDRLAYPERWVQLQAEIARRRGLRARNGLSAGERLELEAQRRWLRRAVKLGFALCCVGAVLGSLNVMFGFLICLPGSAIVLLAMVAGQCGGLSCPRCGGSWYSLATREGWWQDCRLRSCPYCGAGIDVGGKPKPPAEDESLA